MKQWPFEDVQNPAYEPWSLVAAKSMRWARHLDLKWSVENKLFFALPLTNKSGLLGRYIQSAINEFRWKPFVLNKGQKYADFDIGTTKVPRTKEDLIVGAKTLPTMANDDQSCVKVSTASALKESGIKPRH